MVIHYLGPPAYMTWPFTLPDPEFPLKLTVSEFNYTRSISLMKLHNLKSYNSRVSTTYRVNKLQCGDFHDIYLSCVVFLTLEGNIFKLYTTPVQQHP